MRTSAILLSTTKQDVNLALHSSTKAAPGASLYAPVGLRFCMRIFLAMIACGRWDGDWCAWVGRS